MHTQNKIVWYFLVFFALFFLALFVSYDNQWYTVPAAITILMATDTTSFRVFIRWRLIFSFFALMFVIPLILGTKDAVLWGIPYSSEYFRVCLVMVYRGVIIMMALKMLTNHISLTQVSGMIESSHLRNFGKVFGTAVELTPHIRTLVTRSYRELQRERKSKNKSNYLSRAVTLLSDIILFVEQYPHGEEEGEEND